MSQFVTFESGPQFGRYRVTINVAAIELIQDERGDGLYLRMQSGREFIVPLTWKHIVMTEIENFNNASRAQ